jgi:hypothetical protein
MHVIDNLNFLVTFDLMCDRVCFCSRERFGEDRAKVWWEQNRDRIQAQYL